MSNEIVLVFVLYWTTAGQCAENSLMLPYERTSIDDWYFRFPMKNIIELSNPMPVLVIGASKAKLGEFTQIASIGWTQQDGTVEWSCGGSLIWDNFILTAAHCTSACLKSCDMEEYVAPDVARLGDINIYSDEDDKYAQQLKIVRIITHPKYRFGIKYYDIALMQLETYIKKDSFIRPVCLWMDDEIPFPRLLAAGWGATGYAEANSKILLKTELPFVNNTDCEKYYKAGDFGLRYGLQDHQFCAGSATKDLCPGDSGGPLHVNLHSFNGRQAPFLVGVTSFGRGCGFSVPGVFVKVSKFTEWIIQKLQFYGETVTPQKLEPINCARRYHDAAIPSDVPNLISYRLDAHYIVSIQWPKTVVPVRTNCSGTLIESNIVVTLAQCASYRGLKPERVVFLDSTEIKIKDVIVHPNYTGINNPYQNNIAVLKLEIRALTEPAYGWYASFIPGSDIKAHGYDTYNTRLTYKSSIVANTECNIVEQYSSMFPHGLQDEHICFLNRPFLVPNTCTLQLGAPIQRFEPKYNFVWGLNMVGQECGFGIPAVGVRLSAHKAWLESVLLSHSQSTDPPLHIDPDLEVSDECKYVDGIKGTCTPEQSCPEIHIRQQSKRQIIFCTNSTVVCCPEKVVNRLSIPIENEFNECEGRYQHIRTLQHNNTSHIVKIGWQVAENVTFGCFGYLISTRGVVSSASCLLDKENLPNIVQLGLETDSENSAVMRIERTEIHPKYNASTQHHNIAIIKLKSAIEPTKYAFPVCLWQNLTHSPVLQDVYDFETKRTESIYSVYQSECESFVNGLAPEMTCVKPGWIEYSFRRNEYDYLLSVYGLETICFKSGSPVAVPTNRRAHCYVY